MAKKKVGRPQEWTPEELKKLGKELHDFCKREDVYHISEFEVVEKEKSPGWLKWLAKDYPEFSSILKGAKHILGQKIVKQAMGGAGNNWIIGRFVPMYLQDVDDFDEIKKDREHERSKALEKHKKELNQASEEQAEDITERFNKLTDLAYENKKLREELEKLKGS